MPYSNVLVKGRIGYNQYSWPLIIMERAKSDKPNTPVLCEVFGIAHECGSIYANEIELASDIEPWEGIVKEMGFDPTKRYFKGILVCNDQSSKTSIIKKGG